MEKEKHEKLLSDYSVDIFYAYRSTKFQGEDLWIDFINDFRPHMINSWARSEFSVWSDIIIQRGVHVETGRKIQK